MEKHIMIGISTAHVTKETLTKLGKTGKKGIKNISVYKKGDYGFFIYVPEKRFNMDPPNKDLKDIFEYARKYGAGWIMLDCDVEPINGLTIYPQEKEE